MAFYPVVNRASLVMPGASAYALGLADLEPFVATTAETFATHHWLFGSDYPDLADLLGGEKLQQTAPITVTAAGAGYETTGALAFEGGGSGASGMKGIWVANASGGIASAYITALGSGYTSIPAITAVSATGSGATMTMARGAAPTINVSSITTASGIRNGLIAPIPDSRDETVCAVVKAVRSGSPGQVLWGTAVNDSRYVNGSMVYNDRSSAATYKTLTRARSAFSGDAPAGALHGTYMFVAMTHKSSGERILYYGGPVPTVYTQPALPAAVKSIAASPLPIGLGNAYYTDNNFAASVECAELIRFGRGLSIDDLAAVYGRSKARMAARPSPIAVF